LGGSLYKGDDGGCGAGVGFDCGCFHPVGGFEFFREFGGGGGVVGVVDGDVAALGRECAGDFGAEASVLKTGWLGSLVLGSLHDDIASSKGWYAYV
jgi:hypothetical protein